VAEAGESPSPLPRGHPRQPRRVRPPPKPIAEARVCPFGRGQSHTNFDAARRTDGDSFRYETPTPSPTATPSRRESPTPTPAETVPPQPSRALRLNPYERVPQPLKTRHRIAKHSVARESRDEKEQVELTLTLKLDKRIDALKAFIARASDFSSCAATNELP